MTVFNERNLLALADVQHDHAYAQVIAKAQLKALYETDRLTPAHWKTLGPLISDRRWIHALKLGLLTEDEFYDGARDVDKEVEPGHDIHAAPEPDVIEQDASINPIFPIISDDVDTSKIEHQEAEEITETDISSDENDVQVDSDEIINLSPDEQTSEPQEKPEVEKESLIATEEGADIKSEEADSQEKDKEMESLDEQDEEVEQSFVGWLKTLPTVAGYEQIEYDTDDEVYSSLEYRVDEMKTPEIIVASASDKKEEKKKKKKEKSKAKKEEKKAEKEKKKQAKKAKKKAAKKKAKLKKQKKAKKAKKKAQLKKLKKLQKLAKKRKKKKKKAAKDQPAFQDRVVGSLLLNDSIASETLASLLHEHGHHELARKMYERLASAPSTESE